jgi:hypothetical protein
VETIVVVARCSAILSYRFRTNAGVDHRCQSHKHKEIVWRVLAYAKMLSGSSHEVCSEPEQETISTPPMSQERQCLTKTNNHQEVPHLGCSNIADYMKCCHSIHYSFCDDLLLRL